MKTIKGDLVLTENTIIDDDLTVEGNIRCEGGKWDLKCWDLDCEDLDCEDLKCRDLKCMDLKCMDLDCRDLDCKNLDCWNLKCDNLNCGDLNCGELKARNVSYYGVAFAYSSMEVESIKGRRDNSKHFCLDSKIVIKKKVPKEITKDGRVYRLVEE